MRATGLIQRLSHGFRAAAILTLLLLTSCTIQLATEYDPALLSGIRDVNRDIMSLYSATSMGVPPDTFPQRADRYDKIIGQLDALALQSQSRPVPDSALRTKIEAYLKSRRDFPTSLSEEDERRLAEIGQHMAASCAIKLKLGSRVLAMSGPVSADTLNIVPSAAALMRASQTLVFMRNLDCAKGLRAMDVQANKGQMQHFMFEALAYEDFLDRQGSQ
jgi:hypothetical protein